jgi:hypothetical protein
MKFSSALSFGSVFGLMLWLSAPSVRAQSPAPARPEAGKEYKLVHRSAFAGSEGDRNPFWPIGWKPAPPGPATPEVPQAEAPPEVGPENFIITTISLEATQPLAVINGRTHGVGDRLPVDANGKQFVTVRKIIDGAVIFDYHGKEIRSLSGRRSGGPAAPKK